MCVKALRSTYRSRTGTSASRKKVSTRTKTLKRRSLLSQLAGGELKTLICFSKHGRNGRELLFFNSFL